MSSIPLPALAAQPPQQQSNPLDTLARLMQIKGAQQQLQTGALENQQRQLALKDQQVLRSSAQGLDWSQPDAFDKFIQNGQKNGVSPQTLSQMAMQRQQYLKSIAETDEATNKATVARNNILLGHLDAIPPQDKADPQMRAQVAQAQAKQILQNNLVKDPQTIQTLTAVAQGQHVPTDAEIQVVKSGLLDHNTQIEQTLKAAQTGEATAKAGEATAQTKKINQEMMYGPTGPAAEGRYRFVLQKLQQGQEVSPEDLAFAKSFEASNAKNTTQSDTLGVTSTNTSRPAGLSMIGRGGKAGVSAAAGAPGAQANPTAGGGNPNATKDSIVDLVGQYRYSPMQLSRLVTKHPDILGAVQQKYPDFDQTNYEAKSKLIQSYTSGEKSNEINAINTAMGHLKDLDDAVDALNNGNITALNSLGNKIGVNVTGQTAASAFQTIVHRVGPEITSAYIKGGGGEGERGANEKDFDPSLPPQTLHNNAAISVNLLRSKIGALENQYKQQVGRGDFTQRFITPQAQASLQKFGGSGAGAPSPQSNVTKIKVYNPQTGKLE